MASNLRDILLLPPMDGATINGWIRIPSSVVILIFIVTAVIMALTAAYFVWKKSGFSRAIRKSLIVAFFCSGLLFLAYSDATWYGWVVEDMKTYSGYSTEKKTKIFVGPLFDFITVARTIVKDDSYSVYSYDIATGLMVQYYLLPKRNRSISKYVLVLYDNDSYYDVGDKTFVRQGRRIENAELLFLYDPGAFILGVK
ncbi:MAG: hypothetical protein EHM54_00525 [Nitrospiraceae bacterium]|nr:MAG: hypothetical protein EHM54_00525 [Nitrospiraceae bacterium]